MELTFSVCNRVEDRSFSDAMAIYQKAFPSNERQPMDVIERRVKAGNAQLYLGYLADTVVSLAMLWNLNGTEFILLDYLAVKEDQGNRHVGSTMFHFLSSLAKDANKHLLLEVEHPSFGLNRIERARRLAFYLKNGASILKDTPYLLPALDGSCPTEMLLLIAPASANCLFERSHIVALIAQVYRELYQKAEDDELLLSFIGRVPERVTTTHDISEL